MPGRPVEGRSALDRETVVRIHPGQSVHPVQRASLPSGSFTNMCSMKERIKVLLEKGWSRQRIACELGVDPSTVTRHARLLGCPDVHPRRSSIDWNAVQKYYDAGHTINECGDRFGFSYGAWDRAAVRGDIVSRPRSRRQLSRMTRDRVELLLAKGSKPAEIARASRHLEVDRGISLPETRTQGRYAVFAALRLGRCPTCDRQRRSFAAAMPHSFWLLSRNLV